MDNEILKQVLDGIQNLQNEMKSMKREQEKTNDRLEKIESRLDKIENKLDGTVEQTAKLSEYHSEVMNKLDDFATKEDLAYFDKKLSEHDREIFKLKNA